MADGASPDLEPAHERLARGAGGGYPPGASPDLERPERVVIEWGRAPLAPLSGDPDAYPWPWDGNDPLHPTPGVDPCPNINLAPARWMRRTVTYSRWEPTDG